MPLGGWFPFTLSDAAPVQGDNLDLRLLDRQLLAADFVNLFGAHQDGPNGAQVQAVMPCCISLCNSAEPLLLFPASSHEFTPSRLIEK
jgi:hypothetical protein